MVSRVFVTVFVLLLTAPLIAEGGYNARRKGAKLTVTESPYQNGSSTDTSPQLNLSTVQFFPDQDSCSACVRVHARITLNVTDLPRTLKIYLHLSNGLSKAISIKRGKNGRLKWEDDRTHASGTTKIKHIIHHPYLPDNSPLILWELVYDCMVVEAGEEISVSFSRNTGPRISHTVKNICPDPVPTFKLSVDERSRSLTVTVETGDRVITTRLCYRKTDAECTNLTPHITEIDPSVSLSANLSFPLLLPCVCVQVYYKHVRDAKRVIECPFNNVSPGARRDVWLSGNSTLYGETSLAWISTCPPAYFQPSASLCWRDQEPLCIPVLNSTLEVTAGGKDLRYNTSAVDKHPQMCIQFSFRGSQHVQCPFPAAYSRWEVSVSPGWRSLHVHVTSSVPASFSAQLCVLEEGEPIARGPVHSVRMGGGASESRMNLPLAFLTRGLCVQVWQSDPAHLGRRFVCPDYSHKRFGLLFGAALTALVTVAMLGSCIYHTTKRGVADWLSVQRPVLLVCSSEQSAHMSAVCALASILQGELSAVVRMAMWAQSSAKRQTESGAAPGAGVADLGPVPWLYGQWEAMRVAGGKVLITWSPEAKTSYKHWKKERSVAGGREGRMGESRKEEATAGEEVREAERGPSALCEERTQREPTLLTGPLFWAALSCLHGAMRKGSREHGCVLVYFQGLCRSRDIPKDLRGIPRYCLPQDFRGLIQELEGETGATQRWRCWPRLLSKTLSLWLARRLSRRLTAWLPEQTPRSKEGPGRKSAQEVTEQEKEPLSGSPCR